MPHGYGDRAAAALRAVGPRRPPCWRRPPGPPRTARCSRWPTRWSRVPARSLTANAADVADARAAGTSAAMIDRLALDAARVAAMADGLRQAAALPDPVGEVVRGSTLANGWSCGRSGCRSASSG